MEAMRFLKIEMEDELLGSKPGVKLERLDQNESFEEDYLLQDSLKNVLYETQEEQSESTEEGFPKEDISSLKEEEDESVDQSLSLDEVFDLYFRECLGPNPVVKEDGEIENLFVCLKCSHQAGNEDELRTHILAHYDLSSLDMGEVEGLNLLLNNKIFEFYFRQYLDPKSIKEENGGCKEDHPLICSKCSHTAVTEEALKSHILGHYDIRAMSNSLASLIGDLNFELDETERNHLASRRSGSPSRSSQYGAKTYTCTECDFRTSYRSNLRKHRLIHSDTKRFRCPECCYQTNFKDSLKKHALTHTDVKLFKCDLCPYETSIKGHLKRHSLTHTDVKKYSCKDCDYATNHKIHLKTHILNHEGTLFKCPQCEYGTNVKGSLKRHFLTHNDTKLYRCQECSYQTNRQSYLKAHVLSHSGMKLFKCEICHYQTNQKVHLNAHALKHSGLNLFKCVDCSYETNYKHGLKRHLKSHHKKHVQSD